MKKIRDYISASQIDKFNFCPLAYKYIYVDGAKRVPANPYMVYGTAVHQALFVNNTEKIRTKKDLKTNAVINEFDVSFAKEIKSLNCYVDDNLCRTLQLEGQNSITHYMQHVAPTIKPLHAELEYEVKLKHFPITIKGFIDLIEEDYTIRDYKTAGVTTKNKWTQRVVDKNKQLTLYAAAFRKLFDKEESRVCIDVLPRGGGHTPVYSTRSKGQIVELLSEATDIETLIELGVFMPNLQNCSQCDFKNTCEKRLYIDENLKK